MKRMTATPSQPYHLPGGEGVSGIVKNGRPEAHAILKKYLQTKEE